MIYVIFAYLCVSALTYGYYTVRVEDVRKEMEREGLEDLDVKKIILLSSIIWPIMVLTAVTDVIRKYL
jgi:hypothetical protein